MGKCRRHWGDRYDGRLIRKIDPFYKIVPYIMKSRADAQNFFDDKIEINNLETYIRSKRSEGFASLSLLHVIIAAMVRTLSQKPGINRFIAGQKIYARNEILISLAVKKQLNNDGLETTIKLKFDPSDTLMDIVKKVDSAVKENKRSDLKNDTDLTARVFMMFPGFLIRFLIWLLKSLDYFGLMPRALNRVSPFHTSVFITDLGSLGIQPVYHHLYEFGTTSVFLAFGLKQKQKVIGAGNNIVEKRYINIRAVTDERTVDGYYYASAFKFFRRMLQHPEELEYPPERIIEDNE